MLNTATFVHEVMAVPFTAAITTPCSTMMSAVAVDEDAVFATDPTYGHTVKVMVYEIPGSRLYGASIKFRGLKLADLIGKLVPLISAV